MKKSIYLICLPLLLLACSKQNPAMNPEGQKPPQNKMHTVSLSLGGELIVGDDEPMFKSEVNNDLYGIQVRRFVIDELEEPEYSRSTVYGCALFDDPSKIRIDFEEGYVYYIDVVMVRDGQKILLKTGANIYTAPFYSAETTMLNFNSFTYRNSGGSTLSTIRYFSGDVLRNEQTGMRYDVYRYQGYKGEFTPSEENTVLGIDMKLMSYGMRVTAEDVTEGFLRIQTSGQGFDLSDTDKEREFVAEVRMPSLLSHENFLLWMADDYTGEVSFTAYWHKDDGTIVPQYDTKIPVKRKRLQPVIVPAYDVSLSNGVLIVEEDATLEEDTPITLE